MKTVGAVMTVDVQTVGPELKLPDLERALIDARVSGFPVLEDRRLVGLVSRSDVVRKLAVEQTFAETINEFYVDLGAFEPPADSLVAIGERAPQRADQEHGHRHREADDAERKLAVGQLEGQPGAHDLLAAHGQEEGQVAEEEPAELAVP